METKEESQERDQSLKVKDRKQATKEDIKENRGVFNSKLETTEDNLIEISDIKFKGKEDELLSGESLIDKKG